jgi:toxin ParE1/3/4
MTYRLSSLAEKDLRDVAVYIARDNRTAARNWAESIREKCRILGDMRDLGVRRDDLREGLQTFPVGNYLILYKQVEIGIEVVRVLHGARQWQKLL